MPNARARMLGSLLLTLACGYAGLLLILYLMQDRLLFLGAHLDPGRAAGLAARAPDIEVVSLQAEAGVRVHGWYARARRSPAPALLYFGGNAEEVSWTLEPGARPAGFGWLALNYRGYGASGGRPGETALYRDAERAYDWLAARADVDRGRIAVFGRSLGAAVAIHVASVRPVRAAVLVTPFDSLLAVARRHYPYAPVAALLRHRFDSIGPARTVRAPALILAAGADDIIPPAHAERLYRAWTGERQWVLLENRGHNDVSAHPDYPRHIDAFLRRTM
jgi:hypothetical protein